MPSQIDQLVRQSVEHFNAGRLGEARAALEQALGQNPNHFDTLVYLADVESRTGRRREAAAYLARAVKIKKSDPVLRYALGEQLAATGDFAGAITAYAKAIDLQANYFEAHYAMGNLLDRMNQAGEALEHLRRASQIRPSDPGSVVTMTMLLLKLGRVDESIAMGRRAIAMAPQSAIAHINYGNALVANKRMADGADEYRIAIACEPAFGPAHNALAVTLQAKEDFDQAAVHLERCIELAPDFPVAWANLSQVLLILGEVSRAIELLRRALRVHPTITLWDSLLFALSYTDASQQQILREHQEMLGQFPVETTACPARTAMAGRSIRVGYISPDFREHAAASFIEPILKYHDRQRFKVFCYWTMSNADEVTSRLQSYPATWRNIKSLSDAEATEQIQKDQLDILIDLAGRTADNRISLLYRRLASVQVSYLGYPTTTGLPTIDVRLTDAIADPVGLNEAFYSERLVRLPECFCCFAPPANPPEVSALPAKHNGYVTFGSLHGLPKINDHVLDLWAQVLRAVPSSRLLLFRNTLTEKAQSRLRDAFAAREIDLSRMTFHNQKPAGGYLAVYNEIDISLDTFPFTGHTTACQSLLMGVPIITLRGDSHRHCLVATTLTHAGFPHWIATTPEQYVQIAQSLCSDLNLLADIRRSLRDQFIHSPLCDGEKFTRQFESTLISLLA